MYSSIGVESFLSSLSSFLFLLVLVGKIYIYIAGADRRDGQDEEDADRGRQSQQKATAAVESLGVVYDDSAISRTERNQKVGRGSGWMYVYKPR